MIHTLEPQVLTHPAEATDADRSRTGEKRRRRRSSAATRLPATQGFGEELSTPQQHLALFLRHAKGFVLFVADEGRIHARNGDLPELLGADIEVGESLGESPLAACARELVRRIQRALAARTEAHFEWFSPTCRKWIELHAYPTPGGLTVFGFDVTEKRQLQESGERRLSQLVYQASYDVATGLLNRRAFQSLLERTCREAPRESFKVLHVDLDGFKSSNDSFGHARGDWLLRKVAERLRNCLGEEDVLARLGNDEFGILCAAGGTTSRASKIALRIIDSLRQPLVDGDIKVTLTASVGMAQFPQDGATAETLVTAADLAARQVKQEGGNGWKRFHTEMQTAIRRHRLVREGLNDALLASRLTLHYQPVVDIQRGVVTSLEALIRWNHPEQGLLLPEQFLPMAEQAGTIVPIGEWTLATACREATNWPGRCGVAVNISPRQFRSNLVRAVSHALGESRIEAGRLILEVSEAVLADQPEKNLESLRRLRSLGVRVVLDGFGTGTTPLRYLHQFPFDRVKIDRGLIQSVGLRRDKVAIVRSMIGVARELGMEVVAKGVETPDELQRLRDSGCHHAQGFLFSKPMEADAAIRYLRRCAAGELRN